MSINDGFSVVFCSEPNSSLFTTARSLMDDGHINDENEHTYNAYIELLSRFLFKYGF